MWVLPGLLLFLVVSSVVGTRLLLLWRRTRQLPELLIGLGVLGIGPLGFGCSAVSAFVASTAPRAAVVLAITGATAATVGIAAKFLFNWRVYHPEGAWAARIAQGGMLLSVVTLAGGSLLGGYPDGLEIPRWYLTRGALQALCLLWGAAEALRYWGRMKRRQRLGLSDPTLTNRFLLWGIAAGAAGFGTALGITFQIATGIPAAEVPALLLSSSLHGMVAAIAMWLAFVPPAAYTRWLDSRACPSA
jgi:hypothetical protein